MSFIDFFRSRRPTTASVAKERLQIIVAHERVQRGTPDYLPALQRDILEVIRKYVQIEDNQVSVKMDKADNCAVLELNVTLPGGAVSVTASR
jgi:cell division topological specificity factor